MRPTEIDQKFVAACQRRETGMQEVEAANRELGECFAEVIDKDLDLKAHARRANVSRTTAYSMAEKFGPKGDGAPDVPGLQGDDPEVDGGRQVEFRVRQWNPTLKVWEWDSVTATSEVDGVPYYCLASSAFVPASNWEVVEARDDGDDPFPPVEAGTTAAAVAESGTPIPDHDCMASAVPYVSDGALGHGWECGVCGEFLQAG